VATLPWGHNVLLLQKIKNPILRLWYARKAMEHGWSRAILTYHIERNLHEHEGKALTNFQQTLPPPQSDLAQQVLKDPYALRDVRKPIGVAEWKTKLVESLPQKLLGSLPTVEEIEAELEKPAQNAEVRARAKRKRK
jgi:hypothetical protein